MRLIATLILLLLAAPVTAQPYLYWATKTDGSIARSNLDGSGVDESFVTDAPSLSAVHVAGDFLFWTRQFGTDTGVGRVGLDGSDPNPNLIHEATIGRGLASDGGTLYIARGFGNDITISTAGFDGSGYMVLNNARGAGHRGPHRGRGHDDLEHARRRAGCSAATLGRTEPDARRSTADRRD